MRVDPVCLRPLGDTISAMKRVYKAVRRLLRPIGWAKDVVVRSLRHSWRRRVALSDKDILEALRTLGPLEGPGVMVHSSLSSCGQIIGGAPVVLQALREWSYPKSIVMPTHTYSYSHPGVESPVFDRTATPSRVGSVTETFWRQPGVSRSLHPSHSLACEGPLSDELCDDERMSDTPCGEGTPYQRLLQRNVAVLMFGVSMNSYTLFHTAEDAAEVSYLYRTNRMTLRWRDASGRVSSYESRIHDMSFERRFAEVGVWLEGKGLLSRVPLGFGSLLFIPSAIDVHDALVTELARDPWFLVDKSSRPKS
jgi:aminoglycoside 3-N-acetyltransferase